MSCAKMAEPIDLSFGLWTRVGLEEAQVQSYSPGCANVLSLCTNERRNLANTILQSICGGDAALYQITLTTCYTALLAIKVFCM